MSGSRTPLPEGQAKVSTVRGMFDKIAPRYDLVNRIMTFGMDVGWRKKSVRALRLPRGSTVLDVACGTGDFCRELEGAGMHAIGIDLSGGMLAAAKTTAPLAQADALRMPFPLRSLDGITCGFALRNVVDLEALFAEFGRVLRSGGRFAALEVAEPSAPVIRWGHRIYFTKVVPLIGGTLSDRDAYRYLPRSVAYLPDRAGLHEVIMRGGFDDLVFTAVALGSAQIITGTRV